MNRKFGSIKFSPIAMSVLLSFTGHASISMQNGNTNSVNNVPVVDINAANSNGISHNIYTQLNVGKEGVIFNNSQKEASTVLAGKIAGNSNLVLGTAKVILNEVTSKNQSALNGFMEVAGDKAHLIIANPNGITCNNCGFINTEKTTLTTGKPDMQNGELKGFTVNSGKIQVSNLVSDSPTAILSRSAVISGNLRSSEIAIVAGNNYVDTNNKVTGTVDAVGARNIYSVDVAKVGGMYANKILLVSTENGVGVRNAGVIAAGDGGLQLDAKGHLINSNAQIKSTGNIGIKMASNINNVTGKIMSEKSINIDSNKNTIDNSRAGNILASKDIAIGSGAFNNTNGKVSAGNELNINTNGSTLTNSGKGKSVGMDAASISLQTGHLDNRNGQIKSYYFGSMSGDINNSRGTIDVYGNIDISNKGSVNNTGGLIRSATGHLIIDTSSGVLTNGQTKTADVGSNDSLGLIAGDGGIEISAATFNNSHGQIVSSGDIKLLSLSSLNNSSGKIVGKKAISVQAASLNNGHAGLSAEGDVSIDLTGAFQNHIGVVSAKEGALKLKAKSINNHGGMLLGQEINLESEGDINNDTAFIVAHKDLTIQARGTIHNQNGQSFGKFFGFYLGVPNQEGGIVSKNSATITANGVNNIRSRVIAETGKLNLVVTRALLNDHGLIVSRADADIKADSIYNHYGTIFSDSNLNIDTRTLTMLGSGDKINNNVKGIIASDKDLTLHIGSNYTNSGWISAKNKTTVMSTGTLFNFNTIHSGNELTVKADNAVYNYKDIASDNLLKVTSSGTIYNLGNMFTEGNASITGKTVTNLHPGVLGGRNGLDLNADSVFNTGHIIGR